MWWLLLMLHFEGVSDQVYDVGGSGGRDFTAG